MTDLHADGSPQQEPVALSLAGEARRAEILRSLDATMRRRNGVRAVRRASITAAGVAGVVTLAVMWPMSSSPRITAPPVEARSLVSLVVTDPDILDRLAAPAVQPLVQTVTDDELRALLATAGEPSGFIRTGGRVILASELEPIPEPEPPANDTSS